MADTSAEVAEASPTTRVRVDTHAKPHAAASRGSGSPEPSRSRSLLIVAALLFAVLVGGSYFVVRAFRTTSSTEASEAANPSKQATRGAAAIEAALAAAQSYANNREYSKAEAILSQAVAEHPSDQPLRLELARTLVAQQQFADAYPHYEAALAIGAGSADSASQTSDGSSHQPDQHDKRARLLGDPKLHFEAGTVASKAGLLDRAEEHYTMAQSGDMSDPRYPLFLGMTQLRLNRESAAQASLVRAVTLDPNQSAAWGTLAELSLKNNDLRLSLQHIEKARALDASSPRWRLVQAKALKRRGEKGDIELAAQLLLSMDKSEQLRPESLAVISECYGMLRRASDAAALYAEASRLKPDDAERCYQAALWYQRASNVEQAVRYAKAAAALGHAQARSLVKDLEAK